MAASGSLLQQLKSEETHFDVISVLMDTEKRLRELASDLQLRRGDPLKDRVREVDVMEISGLRKSIENLYYSSELWEKWEKKTKEEGKFDLMKKTRITISSIYDALNEAELVARDCRDLAYHDQFCVKRTRLPRVLEAVKDLKSKVKDLTGRACGFTESYDLPSLLNDISNCTHVLAEWLTTSGLPVSSRKVSDRCNVLPGADERLVDLCVKWDEKVEDMHRKNAYVWQDYNALTALIDKDVASFRVGSSPGHAAQVRSDGTLIYHDEDASVINPVKYLMELNGYECEMIYVDQLRCIPSDPNVLNNPEIRSRLADVLSWATSADVRIANRVAEQCEEECVKEKRRGERLRSCIENCIFIFSLDERKKLISRERRHEHFKAEDMHPAIMEDISRFIGWHQVEVG